HGPRLGRGRPPQRGRSVFPSKRSRSPPCPELPLCPVHAGLNGRECVWEALGTSLGKACGPFCNADRLREIANCILRAALALFASNPFATLEQFGKVVLTVRGRCDGRYSACLTALSPANAKLR